MRVAIQIILGVLIMGALLVASTLGAIFVIALKIVQGRGKDLIKPEQPGFDKVEGKTREK